MASPGCTNRIQPTASSSLSSSSSSPRHKLVASYNLSPRAAGPATPSCVGRLPSPLGPCTRRTAALPRLEDLYHLQRVIGQGAYGVVWMAVDRRTGRRVAVKKIADVFGDTKEAKRTLREVRLMRHFRGSSPHVLAILDLLPMAPAPAPESSEEGEGEEEVVSASNFRDLYVVTEFVDGGDLSQECNKSAPGWKAPDEERAKAVALGLLSGLRVIHRARVLHRDVRPKNVLTGSGGAIKIADFGMGRGKAKKVEKTQNRMKLSLMEFVSNRYYTAPEGLLPNNEYSYPVDVWAVGCVVAEMLLGYNIFKDSRFPDQMRTVINVTGTPTEEDIASIANGRNEKFRAYIRTVQAQEPDRLWTLLPNLSPDGKHFLRRLLAFNPTKRATTEEALDHPWLRSVSAAPSSDPDARPGATSEEVAPFDGRDIEAAEEEADLRRLLWKEIESYRAVDAVDWSEETRV